MQPKNAIPWNCVFWRKSAGGESVVADCKVSPSPGAVPLGAGRRKRTFQGVYYTIRNGGISPLASLRTPPERGRPVPAPPSAEIISLRYLSVSTRNCPCDQPNALPAMRCFRFPAFRFLIRVHLWLKRIFPVGDVPSGPFPERGCACRTNRSARPARKTSGCPGCPPPPPPPAFSAPPKIIKKTVDGVYILVYIYHMKQNGGRGAAEKTGGRRLSVRVPAALARPLRQAARSGAVRAGFVRDAIRGKFARLGLRLEAATQSSANPSQRKSPFAIGKS
jgi:hypothetical protein